MPDSYVLDAHAIVWQLEGNPKLGQRARDAFADPTCRFFLPAIALAEACYLISRGRVNIAGIPPFLATIDADPRIQVVPLDRNVVERSTTIGSISEMHDSQIVATALELIDRGERVAILTKDANIAASGLVPVAW